MKSHDSENQIGLDAKKAKRRVEEREGQVWASVGALLSVIERERTGLHLFKQGVEMLKANEHRLQPSK